MHSRSSLLCALTIAASHSLNSLIWSTHFYLFIFFSLFFSPLIFFDFLKGFLFTITFEMLFERYLVRLVLVSNLLLLLLLLLMLLYCLKGLMHANPPYDWKTVFQLHNQDTTIFIMLRHLIVYFKYGACFDLDIVSIFTPSHQFMYFYFFFLFFFSFLFWFVKWFSQYIYMQHRCA